MTRSPTAGQGAVGDDLLLARAYLSRVAEPANLRVWEFVCQAGAITAAAAIRARDVPDDVRSATEARANACDPHADLDAASRRGMRLVVPESGEWPHVALSALERTGAKLLEEGVPPGLSDHDAWRSRVPPLALWVRGGTGPDSAALATLSLRSAAIVGSRAATSYGEYVAKDLSRKLALRDVDVVSGGAFGIDAAAHRGALSADGTTVIVTAGGVDRPYPPANRALFDHAAERGLIVSESPPGCAPHKGRFLRRNRLIAAFGSGTVVVESAERSGALSTAAHCHALGKPLMAVPGPVTSAMSRGCHGLLQHRDRNTVLVTNAQDVLDVIGGASDLLAELPATPSGPLDHLDPVSRQVLEGLPGRGVVEVAVLAARSGVAPDTLLRTMPALVSGGFVRGTAETGFSRASMQVGR